MRHCYSLMMYLLTPILLVRLWFKGRKMPAYRENIGQRFCVDELPNTTVDVWLHAVSLGEVIAATTLINQLLAKKLRILITTMTPTGAHCVQTRFQSLVMHRYVPYDLPLVLRRFFNAYQPTVGIIMETELWPNLIVEAKNAGVKLLLANARLSERSCRGYQKATFLFKPLLNHFHTILAQSHDDAQRFKRLGVAEHRVGVLGNLKFDLQTKHINREQMLPFKERWGQERTVVMVASTHDNEEQQILACWSLLQKNIPDVLLLLAPRHPERFETVYQLAQQQGFTTGLRSQPDSLHAHVEVIILDCLGELLNFYQLSDYAFMGGSLVPVGGHNMLEPIALGVPVLTGQYIHNFKTICHNLEQEQAIEFVSNACELMEKISALQADSAKKASLIANAHRVFTANKGAVARYVAMIEALLLKQQHKHN